ncbi:acyl-CoA dehydrogenase [Paenibacillus sp.]|jgi:alkylation response protein AidB-like acyl-CoA dehydrogenase|uniref:acyl-CoA dehydrogenase n=1 Tax=Paenibacillus sp. TaxID=58172 RepID=UPI0028228119|nr:acyl-CoA dehydrogenase [Paenibacillus sp.]MDR0271474.1 acyl-CoA dehydrogenase [Paenibacillus sp.]
MGFTQQEIGSIRNQSRQMELEGEITSEALQYIYDKKLFHLFVANDLEGNMTPLPEAIRIFQECARIDGSFGWLVTIGAGGGYFVPFMTEEIGRTVFARPEAVIAGSGATTGTARRVEGGYIVNGRWKYCSGSTHATTFTANAILETEDQLESGEVPQLVTLIMQPDQIQIHKDWNTFGLKATASHSMVVTDAFVPDEMTFSFSEYRSHEDELLYKYPFLAFAQTSFAGVAMGLADHFLEAAEEYLRGRGNEYGLEELYKQKKEFAHPKDAFYMVLDKSWDVLSQKESLSPEMEQRISSECMTVAKASLGCGFKLFPILGLSACMEDTDVNRTWRDLQTACQHALLRG